MEVNPPASPSAWRRLGVLAIAFSAIAAVVALSLPTAAQTAQPSFHKTSLSGASSEFPTSLQFGPDGRLYVAQFDGTIKIYEVERLGVANYAVTATQTINSISNIPNHDDDGTAAPANVDTRLVTGLVVAGTSQNPVIYVTSSDPRIGGGADGDDLNLDTNSGMVSRLTWNGTAWNKLDLVRGLPRSEENHTGNGLALDPETNTLFIAYGGNTNKGAPSTKFALLPEFALSAAIVSIDLDHPLIGTTTYDLPTLDDASRPGNPDANDPFGGNDGNNQAKLVPGGPVQVYSPGYRNPYDLVITEAGRMYTIDNGSNGTWGAEPIGEGPAGSCSNAINPDGGDPDPDHLHLVTPGFYGGHPNPTRGNMANTFNGTGGSVVPTLEQRKAGPAVSATSISVTLDSAPVAGHVLIARVGTTAAGRTFTMTGWTPGPKNDRAEFFYKVAGTGESSTVTANLSGAAANLRLLVDEWSGLDATAPLDTFVNTQKGTGLTSLSTGTTTTRSVPNAVALTLHMLGGNSGGGVAFTNGYSANFSNGPMIAGSKILAGTGPQETTTSWATARAANAIIAVFKGQASGGGTPGESPVTTSNAVECDYRDPAPATGPQDGNLATFQGSTNGITEYTTPNFGGAMTGDLLAAAYNVNAIYRVQLNDAGTAVTSNTTLFSTVGTGPKQVLDVIASGSGDPFPGTIWVANTSGPIHVFEPNDFDGGGGPGCTRADDPSLDEDLDGYDNADEIDNGTDPCSSADVPPDRDGDNISNLNDPDDDNDGQPDTSDPFAIDPDNGTTTSLPVRYGWENNDANPGGFLKLGFTGLMTNGASNYQSLFDPDKMTAGGAAGVLTVEDVPNGDAFKLNNSQEYGFQLGFVPPTSGSFTAHTRIVDPFAGTTPQNNQSMGLFLGTGDQRNYVKITTAAENGTGVRFLKEVADGVSNSRKTALAMPGPDFVDLYLTVDVGTAKLQPSFAVTRNGVTEPRQNVGSPISIPAGWISPGMAVGILSTSRGPGPTFGATWDFIELLEGNGSQPPPGSWSTRASSGDPRQEVSYVEVGGKFYLAGDSTAHEVYDPSTDSWSAVEPLPAPLDHIQAVAVGGKIYYIGGLVSWPSPHVSSVYIYDPVTDSFSIGAPMPRGRGGGGVAVHDGKIYYAGGLSNGTPVAWFDEYDPQTNSWRQLPDMPRARDHFHAAVVDGEFYAIGGRLSAAKPCCANMLTNNDAYSFADGTWSANNAPLPTKRGGFATAVLGNEILIIGGEGGGTTKNAVEAYNTSTDTWRTLSPMPTARHGIQAVVCNGGVYIAAGGTTQGGANPTDVHEVFFLGAPTTCGSP